MKRIMNIFPGRNQRLYPFDFYSRMRGLNPIAYDEHNNIWGVFRYGDVQSVLGDYTTFSSAPQTSDSPISSSNDRDTAPFQRPSLLQSDPPYHRTLRGVISSAFTPTIIAKLESHIENIANEMLNEVILKGKMDLIDDLAYPLPVTIIAELLGVPIDDRNLFRGWADMIVSSTGSDITDEQDTKKIAKMINEMDSYFSGIVEERHRSPRSVNPSTNIAYVANSGDDTVSVIDGKTNKVTANITVGKTYAVIGTSPNSLSVNPSTNIVYVTNEDDDTLSVIDGKTNTIIANTTVGTIPVAVSVNPSTNIAYVANRGDNTVSVIDGKTNKVTATIPVGTSPNSLSVNPSTNIVYVANRGDNTVSVIDGETNKGITNINVGPSPLAVSVNPSTNIAYVANHGDDTVSVIDGKTNTVTATIPVSQYPSAVSVNPSTNIAYVANRGDNTVSVIDGKTNTLKPIK